jgi:hypothetical protein
MSDATPSDPPLDWPSLYTELGSFAEGIIHRFVEKASENADHARRGEYGRNEWLADVEWFWTNLAGDAVRGIEIVRSKLPPA